MNDSKCNSNRFKEQNNKPVEKRAEKVVTGAVITKKKSGIRKFTDEFISGDANSMGSYLIKDVIVPTAKKLLSDIVNDGLEILLYGESRGGNKRSTSERVSYRSYYDNGRSTRETRRVSEPCSYDDLIFSSRGEAEEVLDRMFELLEKYGVVRVADLYDLAGVTGNYTDMKYGWVSLTRAKIVRLSGGGYMIDMPRAAVID